MQYDWNYFLVCSIDHSSNLVYLESQIEISDCAGRIPSAYQWS